MKTHVTILAQGSQRRMGALPVAKQHLPLPACRNTPILDRTIRQLYKLLGIGDDDKHDVTGLPNSLITVVCPVVMSERYVRSGVGVDLPNTTIKGVNWRYYPDTCTLADPGNSSLKGIQRYWDLPLSAKPNRPTDRWVVLLGDVVYSWACLRAILDVGPPWCSRFVGTSDLSRSGGELWGLSWTWEANEAMKAALAAAVAQHPPFEDYQPGQMRRWLWHLNASRPSNPKPGTDPDLSVAWYTAIDDYTMDVDLPDQIPALGEVSIRAEEDDAREGVTW